MNSASPRPVIGICARTAPVTMHGTGLIVSLTLQAHVDFLAADGCTPVLLPLVPGIDQAVGQLDGLLVPGGPDVDPALYGAGDHPMTRGANPVTDAIELDLIEAALGAGLPLLAICRGLQLLNVRYGGTLHQHLPEITGDDSHCPRTPAYTLGRHRLAVESGSLIAGILADGARQSACHHHQAIDQLGAGLVATAVAQDGVIEAVEAAGHPFALGVQSEAGQTEDNRLHLALAQAARRAGVRTTARNISPASVITTHGRQTR